MNSSVLAFMRLSLPGAAQRYPLTLLFSFLTSSTMIFNIWRYGTDLSPGDPVWLLCFALALGLPLSFCVESLRSSLSLTRIAAVAAVAGCYMFLRHTGVTEVPVRLWNYGWLAAAAHLLCACVPLLTKRGDDFAFWKWNTDLFFRFIVAFFYSGALCIGLLIALNAFAYLFRIEVDLKMIATLMVTILVMFQSIVFVAGSAFEQSIHASLQRPLQRFGQWILLPLLLVYYTLLVAYAGWILISMNLPRGGVATLVFTYALLGILTWLIAWPLKDDVHDAPPLAKFFRKYFLAALIPLMILLGFSLWERLSTYGMTEARYVLSVGYIWMLFIIITFGFGQRRPLYWIPASLCVMCTFASFGPQGMSGFSHYSQWMRLQQTWDESQVNKDPALNKSLSNTYRYLRRFHPSEALESWLASHPLPDNSEHNSAHDRSISLKNFPIRVREHLSLVEFDIRGEFTFAFGANVLSWRHPGKLIKLDFIGAGTSLDFPLDSRLLQDRKKDLIDPEFAVLHSKDPKYKIVILSLFANNDYFHVRGLLLIED